MKFMKYQNERGGKIVLQDVAKPNKNEWTSALEAVEAALQLEKTVNQSLLSLHNVASDNNDAHLCDFLESNFLNEQVRSIDADVRIELFTLSLLSYRLKPSRNWPT